MEHKALLSEIRELIRPSEDTRRRIREITGRIKEGISRKAHGICPQCRVEVEGSVAKGTFLEGQHDIDIFVFFPPCTPRKDLEELILDLGKEWAEDQGLEYEIAYAEHPYVTVKFALDKDTCEVDIVGAYDVDSTRDMKSAVDRTKFHTQYVRQNLDPQLRDQVLLTKQFMSGIGTYGSEIRIGGFSGLLCEVLIIAHGSFLNLLRAAANWEKGHIIDVENLGGEHPDFREPLVVIDPTDGQRNAAAAVTEQKFSLFIHAARSFIKRPRRTFFLPREIEPMGKDELLKKIQDRGTQLVIFRFKRPEVIDDIIFPQVGRLVSSMSRRLADHGFTLVGPSTDLVRQEGDQINVLFELGVHSLPRIEKRYGPRIDRAEDCEKFLEKHRESHPYIEGDKWCVDTERKFWEANSLIWHVLSNNPQGIIPNYVAGGMEKGWSLARDEKAIDSAGPRVREMLTQHFRRVLPWEAT